MPSPSTRFTAVLIAATAGAGALIASPALARGGDHRPDRGPNRPVASPLPPTPL